MAKLVIVRGAPGSGKTTFLLNNYQEYPKAEADDFRDYSEPFNPKMNPVYHAMCLSKTYSRLCNDFDVCVANTFTKKWEVKPYLDMAEALGAEVVIYHCNGTWENVHDVPKEVVERMRRQYEPIEGEIDVY